MRAMISAGTGPNSPRVLRRRISTRLATIFAVSWAMSRGGPFSISDVDRACIRRLPFGSARKVRALDYDDRCVETTKAVLHRFAPQEDWLVGQADVLDKTSLPSETFDIVYSWGVLHHTGDMWTAIRNAADLVGSEGRFGIAIYLKTPLCGLWTIEKRLYSSHTWLRPPVKGIFVSAYILARTLRHRDTISFIRNYREQRGMEFLADVDDWLGGYPYQSTSAAELEIAVEKHGFRVKERFNVMPGIGLFGTGCGEWCFERTNS